VNASYSSLSSPAPGNPIPPFEVHILISVNQAIVDTTRDFGK
jgi:hypothetical protein